MHLSAHLDLDVLAHETDDRLSVLVELTAPADRRRPAPAARCWWCSTAAGRWPALGSMRPRPPGHLVDRLDPHDRFGLVTFDQHAADRSCRPAR